MKIVFGIIGAGLLLYGYMIMPTPLKYKFYVCNQDGTDCRVNAKFDSFATCERYLHLYDYDNCDTKMANGLDVVCKWKFRFYKGKCE